MSNSEISKVVGTPPADGAATRSDNEASKAPKTRSLGEGKFLPDTGRLGYGSEGVSSGSTGRSGPTGRT